MAITKSEEFRLKLSKNAIGMSNNSTKSVTFQ